MLEGFIVKEFDELASTQDYAKELLNDGRAQHGIVISTNSQTSGRGRGVKSWLSNPGNLAITIILKPEADEELFSQVSYLTGIAVGQSISHGAPNLNLEYKWVNDVFINSQKAAGILLEKVGDYLLVGVGVNLDSNKNLEEFNGTSLEDNGIKVSRSEFLERFLEKFKAVYNLWLQVGFLAIKNQWLHNARGLNEKIEIIRPGRQKLSGLFINIDEEGQLLVLSDNKIVTVSAGEMFFNG